MSDDRSKKNRAAGSRHLTPDENEVWDKVKRTAVPLAKRAITLAQYLDSSISGNKSEPVKSPSKENPLPRKPTTVKPYSPGPTNFAYFDKAPGTLRTNALDLKTVRKIAKGRISIDGRIDLHGLTQLEAHDRLFRTLEHAWHEQKRVILVITGKGRVGEGILRQAVPRWLAEPAFNAITSGYSEAHASHGGGGALYVRVKRQRGAR